MQLKKTLFMKQGVGSATLIKLQKLRLKEKVNM